MTHNLTRRSLITGTALAGTSYLVVESLPGTAWARANNRKKIMKTDVPFNSGGFRLAGNLYIPYRLAPGKHPSTVVGRPSSGVKGQTAGIYAIKQAKGPEELFWIDGPTHCGLYDTPEECVPPAVSKMTDFLRCNLSA